MCDQTQQCSDEIRRLVEIDPATNIESEFAANEPEMRSQIYAGMHQNPRRHMPDSARRVVVAMAVLLTLALASTAALALVERSSTGSTAFMKQLALANRSMQQMNDPGFSLDVPAARVVASTTAYGVVINLLEVPVTGVQGTDKCRSLEIDSGAKSTMPQPVSLSCGSSDTPSAEFEQIRVDGHSVVAATIHGASVAAMTARVRVDDNVVTLPLQNGFGVAIIERSALPDASSVMLLGASGQTLQQIRWP